MAWLPYEDPIAEKSEALLLKYNPLWTGCKEKRHSTSLPEIYHAYFSVETEKIFDVYVPFTRESWNGRIKSCRGIGASLSKKEVDQFQTQHQELLARIAPENFHILHYVALTVLAKKDLT